MVVEIVSRDLIKPSSPTPHHLRHLKLSLFDQVAPEIYTQFLIFYAPDSPLTPNAQKSLLLRSSLSQTLTRFYPFAGRIQDDRSIIDCDDSGADYAEARFSSELSKVVEKPRTEMLQQFFVIGPESATKGKLLAVQVTFFDDGGLAIGLGLSHKIFDGPTSNMFLRSWVSSARNDQVIFPEFVLGSLYPAKDCPILNPSKYSFERCKNLQWKRFVFTASKLAQLKKLTFGTRVEPVMTLIWKVCIMESRYIAQGRNSSPVIMGAVDLRSRTRPPLKDSVAGNFTGFFLVKHPELEDVPELHDLVKEMRRALEEHVERGAEDGWVVEMERVWGSVKSMVETLDVERYVFTSCSRIMPLYDLNFGWGRPVFAVPATFRYENSIVLLSTSDGEGLEAWITLESDRMNRFEKNEELLAFTSVDPPVLLLAGDSSEPCTSLIASKL